MLLIESLGILDISKRPLLESISATGSSSLLSGTGASVVAAALMMEQEKRNHEEVMEELEAIKKRSLRSRQILKTSKSKLLNSD